MNNNEETLLAQINEMGKVINHFDDIICELKKELNRCVVLLDGECTARDIFGDEYNVDTRHAHYLLGNFDIDADINSMEGKEGEE